jgi:hypothetical protein
MTETQQDSPYFAACLLDFEPSLGRGEGCGKYATVQICVVGPCSAPKCTFSVGIVAMALLSFNPVDKYDQTGIAPIPASRALGEFVSKLRH